MTLGLDAEYQNIAVSRASSECGEAGNDWGVSCWGRDQKKKGQVRENGQK